MAIMNSSLMLRDHGIRTAFQNYTTLGSILTKEKEDPIGTGS